MQDSDATDKIAFGVMDRTLQFQPLKVHLLNVIAFYQRE
jgi:hypothetical protein